MEKLPFIYLQYAKQLEKWGGFQHLKTSNWRYIYIWKHLNIYKTLNSFFLTDSFCFYFFLNSKSKSSIVFIYSLFFIPNFNPFSYFFSLSLRSFIYLFISYLFINCIIFLYPFLFIYISTLTNNGCKTASLLFGSAIVSPRRFCTSYWWRSGSSRNL